MRWRRPPVRGRGRILRGALVTLVLIVTACGNQPTPPPSKTAEPAGAPPTASTAVPSDRQAAVTTAAPLTVAPRPTGTVGEAAATRPAGVASTGAEATPVATTGPATRAGEQARGAGPESTSADGGAAPTTPDEDSRPGPDAQPADEEGSATAVEVAEEDGPPASAARPTTAGSPAGASAPESAPGDAYAASPEYGAAAFILGNPRSAPRDLALMQAAGLNWLRLDVPWRSIEPSCKNCIDWSSLDQAVQAANAAGIRVMARVDHQPAWSRAIPAENGPPDAMFDYADFLQVMAARYGPSSTRGRGTIHAIQVWNEPNLTREWGGAVIDRGQASQYMYMLSEAYTHIKAVDPAMIVVSAGLSPTGTSDGTAQPDDVYLGWLYEDGLAEVSDVIGAHAPGYGSPPEAAPSSDPRFPHPSFYFRRVEQLRNVMVRNGDAGKQIWLNEFGWTTDRVNPEYSWYAVDQGTQADYIVRAYQYAQRSWSPWIGVMFVWNIADPNWTQANEQYWWSITNPDGSPRPAYDAIANARTRGMLR